MAGNSLGMASLPASRHQEVARTEVRSQDVASIRPVIDEDAFEGLKFSECLPDHLAVEMLEQRLSDAESTKKTLEQNERYVSGVTWSD